MMRSKRAQITIFIILGLVILFTFVIFYYLLSQNEIGGLEEDEIKVIESKIESKKIKFAAQNCLKNALVESILLVGEDGGVIFREHGGLINPNTITDEDKRYTLLIDEDQRVKPPLYPCPLSYVSNKPMYCKYPLYPVEGATLFGKRSIPSLSKGKASIRSQMQYIIKKSMAECAELTIALKDLEQAGQYNVTINEIDKEGIDVVFTFDGTSCSLELPIVVKSVTTGENIVKNLGIQESVPARIKAMYDIVKDIVEKDTSYLGYDILLEQYEPRFEDDLNVLFKYKDHVKLSKEKATIGYDIFFINDSLSNLDGSPLTFKFARVNRPPVVFFQEKNPSTSDLYDFLVVKGEVLKTTINGSDPDEDELDFSAIGDFGRFDSRYIEKSTEGMEPGFYNLTLIASDGMLSDEQVIRVLVDNEIKGHITIKSPYGGRKISIEDPVFIEADIDIDSLDEDVSYQYFWSYVLYDVDGSVAEEVSFQINDSDCISVPGFVACDEYKVDMDEIKKQPFSIATDRGELRFVIKVIYNNRVQEVTFTEDFSVRQCIRHSSSSPPYPYNNLREPYLGNHACCVVDKDTNKIRYASTFENVQCYSGYGKLGCTSDGLFRRRQKVTAHCDGKRGNACLGKKETSWELYSPKQCGYKKEGCSNVHGKCEGKTPYGIVHKQGWCNGAGGCNALCTKEVVDVNGNGPDSNDHCGCTSNDVDKRCDKNFDGVFEGVCTDSGCSE